MVQLGKIKLIITKFNDLFFCAFHKHPQKYFFFIFSVWLSFYKDPSDHHMLRSVIHGRLVNPDSIPHTKI